MVILTHPSDRPLQQRYPAPSPSDFEPNTAERISVASGTGGEGSSREIDCWNGSGETRNLSVAGNMAAPGLRSWCGSQSNGMRRSLQLMWPYHKIAIFCASLFPFFPIQLSARFGAGLRNQLG